MIPVRLLDRSRGHNRFACTVGRLVLLASVGIAATSRAGEVEVSRTDRSAVVATATEPTVKSKDDASAKAAESEGEDRPIRLAYVEGDIAGMSSILGEDGKSVIGMIEYRQHLRGDVLEIARIARFADGSSDEDKVRAHVGKTLRTIDGRSIIRNTKGVATVDLQIDIARDRIKGFSGLGKERKDYDEETELSPATYWGPLIGIVLKNFAENAKDGKLRFHTVVATPKPRAFHMELVREEKSSTMRAGNKVQVERYSLSPSINLLLDPLLQLVTPKTDFFMQAGSPPALARFAGPRNYAKQMIRIE